MQTRSEPLSWYIDKLRRGEPFSALSFGDGELLVASRKKTGQLMQHEERITPRMEEEILAALDVLDEDVLHGTDLHLILPETYQGRDVDLLMGMARMYEHVIKSKPVVWYDATIWDTACRLGELAPLLRVLRQLDVVIIGHPLVCELKFLRPVHTVLIPPSNAYSQIDEIEKRAREWGKPAVFLVCAGLSAIPVIMRLRQFSPGATFLDLGSTLDVFVGLGGNRGWRRGLYENPDQLEEVVKKNLEGVVE